MEGLPFAVIEAICTGLLLARPPADVQESATEARSRSRVVARFDLRAWTERMMELYERCFEGLRPG